MRILVLADIHGRIDMAIRASEAVPDAQIVLIAGDLTNFGDEKVAHRVIEALQDPDPRRKLIAVAGNCDPEPVRRYLADSGYSLEGSSQNLPFGILAGVGGGLKRAGITNFERTEEELDQALKRAIAGIDKNSFTVYLTHTPPYGTNADRKGERHVGSKAFAALLQKHVPDIWVCGHIHESRCVSHEDGSLIVNPGPCGEGYFAVIEVRSDADGWKVASAALSR